MRPYAPDCIGDNRNRLRVQRQSGAATARRLEPVIEAGRPGACYALVASYERRAASSQAIPWLPPAGCPAPRPPAAAAKKSGTKAAEARTGNASLGPKHLPGSQRACARCPRIAAANAERRRWARQGRGVYMAIGLCAIRWVAARRCASQVSSFACSSPKLVEVFCTLRWKRSREEHKDVVQSRSLRT